ncbi:sigma-E processing peptidase SpoIIGA [Gehongia tenuis]|uniref:Sporulation sigma-E factor-processing peptidase n=1 Tax=Gehongia tenuis TaxID=2763655 RepID=A0A926HP58_9FIRM|nr:sigma-E processing peptidase SpoIIGA [Gehongia tenuis]MBC8530868.1 sigma-E processing peptidase SpoIIGA [Gehongia tenuis]
MVYVEDVLLENLAVNALIVLLTLKAAGMRIRGWRLFLSAFLGAAASVAALMLPAMGVLGLLGKVLLSCGMVFLALGRRPVRTLLKGLAIFYGFTFLMGGATFAAAFLMSGGVKIAGGVLYVDGPYAFYLALAGLAAFGIQRLVAAVRRRGQGEVARVELKLFGAPVVIRGLVDTGNCLSEPISGLPVIVVWREAVELPGWFSALERGEAPGDEALPAGVRLVPFRSLGEGGHLWCVKVKDVKVVGSEELVLEEAYVGFAGAGFTPECGYDAVVPPGGTRAIGG